jgi:deazaflavin-dependent oxidoreductase (nitroreductase family)
MAHRTALYAIRKPVTRLFNPLSKRAAGFLPGFGILTHRGRRSGTEYRTPINVFRRGGEWVFVLTYGSDVDWVKNVLAAGGCGLRTNRGDIRLVDPRLVTDPSLPGMPLPVRLIGRVIGATELLVLREAA